MTMRAFIAILALACLPFRAPSQSALTGGSRTNGTARVGTVAQFAVTCPECYTEDVLTPKKLKVTKIERGLGGSIHYVSMSFVCPKCGAFFVTHGTKWVKDPHEVARPPHIEIPPPLPAKTNGVTNP